MDNETHKLRGILRYKPIAKHDLIERQSTKKKERELAKLKTLPSQQITEYNRKKAKWIIRSWTLLGNVKKLFNINVKFIPNLIGVFGTDTKRFVQGLEDLEIRG